MSKFQIGDKVRRAVGDHCGMREGDIGTVAAVKANNHGTGYTIQLLEEEFMVPCGGGSRGDVWHSEGNFELVLPEPVAATDLKPTNPKDTIGNRKLQLGLLPFAFQAETALALTDGKYKYGAHNWAVGGVRASIYIDAALRHITRFNGGEEHDPDSGAHNLGHAAACLAILLDAQSRNVLNDDRPPAHDAERMLQLQEQYNVLTASIIDKHVAHGRAPKHWTIADAAE